MHHSRRFFIDSSWSKFNILGANFWATVRQEQGAVVPKVFDLPPAFIRPGVLDQVARFGVITFGIWTIAFKIYQLKNLFAGKRSSTTEHLLLLSSLMNGDTQLDDKVGTSLCATRFAGPRLHCVNIKKLLINRPLIWPHLILLKLIRNRLTIFVQK